MKEGKMSLMDFNGIFFCIKLDFYLGHQHVSAKRFTHDIYSKKAPDLIGKTPGFLFPLDSTVQMIFAAYSSFLPLK